MQWQHVARSWKTSFQSLDQPDTTVFLWYSPRGSDVHAAHGPDLSVSALQVLAKETVCEWQQGAGWRFGYTNRSLPGQRKAMEPAEGAKSASLLGFVYRADQDSARSEKGARSIAYCPASTQHQRVLEMLAAADFPVSFQAAIHTLLS